MPKKKASKPQEPQELQFIVKVKGNDVIVENESIADIAMVGILSVLLDAYQERFKGGGANAPGETNGGE